MFESWLEESLGDPGALLHLAADNLIAERRAGCRTLLIAAAWADCHGAPDDREPDHRSALVDQYVRSGGMGTPLVSQDCAAELGHALQVSVFAARKLIADALTIRHRLPLLWQRVKDGEVWGWKAAKIAEATRHLGGLSSWALDRQTTPHLELMAWSRFLDVLDAALLRVDEATYQARAEAAAGQRDVRSYRGQYGLRTLVARAEAGDVAAFEALSTWSRTVWPPTVMRTRSGSAGPKPSASSATKPGCGTCWPGTPTSPTTPAIPKTGSPRTRMIRPTRGPPMISHPPAGRPRSTATTTSPASTIWMTSTTAGPARPRPRPALDAAMRRSRSTKPTESWARHHRHTAPTTTPTPRA